MLRPIALDFRWSFVFIGIILLISCAKDVSKRPAMTEAQILGIMLEIDDATENHQIDVIKKYVLRSADILVYENNKNNEKKFLYRQSGSEWFSDIELGWSIKALEERRVSDRKVSLAPDGTLAKVTETEVIKSWESGTIEISKMECAYFFVLKAAGPKIIKITGMHLSE